MAGCKGRIGLGVALACLIWACPGTSWGPVSAFAQTFGSRAEMEAALNPELLENAGRLVRFEQSVICLDTLLSTDAPRTVSFEMVNVSGKTLRLGRVTTTCGCTEASIGDAPLAAKRAKSGSGQAILAAGQKGLIRVTFDPRQSIGPVDTRIFVYLDGDDRHPVGKLRLSGLVKDADPWRYLPVSMGYLRLKRKSVTFEDVRPGQHREVRILCGNSGTTPITPSAELLPPYLKLSSDPETIAPGAEADLVLSLDGSAFFGASGRGSAGDGDIFQNTPGGSAANGTNRLQVIVDGVSGRPIDRMLEVLIQPQKQ